MEITLNLTLKAFVSFIFSSVWSECYGLGVPSYCLEIEDSSSEESHIEMNALLICTNSSILTETKTVYMDASDVLSSVNATCYCTVTFASDEERTITLDYNVKPNPKMLLTIKGFGLQISATGVFNANTYSMRNSLVFNANTLKSKKGLSACLIISTTSAFQAQCFQSGITPSEPPLTSGQTTKSSETNTVASTTDTAFDDSTSEFLTKDTSRPTTHTIPKEDNSSESNSLLDTSRPTTHTTPKEDNSSESDSLLGTIIGAVVGGSAFLIVVVIVTVVLIKKRKRKSTKDNEDYYITENAMYNASVSTPNHPYAEYDTVNATHANNDSSTYAVVDKNKGNQNFEMSSQPEDEYNHLNEIVPAFSTGNVYSTTGNVYTSTGNEYSSIGKI